MTTPRCPCGSDDLAGKFNGESLTPVYICRDCERWLDLSGHVLADTLPCADCGQPSGLDAGIDEYCNPLCPVCAEIAAEEDGDDRDDWGATHDCEGNLLVDQPIVGEG